MMMMMMVALRALALAAAAASASASAPRPNIAFLFGDGKHLPVAPAARPRSRQHRAQRGAGRRRCRWSLPLVAAAAAGLQSVSRCLTEKDHVCSADWAYGDMGANWDGVDPATADPKFPRPRFTPHMDALAASGMRLTDFHTAASVCTPSRAGLLTGRLGLRTGVTHNFNPSSSKGLPVGEITVAEHLKAAAGCERCAFSQFFESSPRTIACLLPSHRLAAAAAGQIARRWPASGERCSPTL
jgi:hypothetical protein